MPPVRLYDPLDSELFETKTKSSQPPAVRVHGERITPTPSAPVITTNKTLLASVKPRPHRWQEDVGSTHKLEKTTSEICGSMQDLRHYTTIIRNLLEKPRQKELAPQISHPLAGPLVNDRCGRLSRAPEPTGQVRRSRSSSPPRAKLRRRGRQFDDNRRHAILMEDEMVPLIVNPFPFVIAGPGALPKETNQASRQTGSIGSMDRILAEFQGVRQDVALLTSQVSELKNKESGRAVEGIGMATEMFGMMRQCAEALQDLNADLREMMPANSHTSEVLRIVAGQFGQLHEQSVRFNMSVSVISDLIPRLGRTDERCFVEMEPVRYVERGVRMLIQRLASKEKELARMKRDIPHREQQLADVAQALETSRAEVQREVAARAEVEKEVERALQDIAELQVLLDLRRDVLPTKPCISPIGFSEVSECDPFPEYVDIMWQCQADSDSDGNVAEHVSQYGDRL
jgi:hypothetical protein